MDFWGRKPVAVEEPAPPVPAPRPGAYLGSHDMGAGDMSITGEFASNKNSFSTKAVYRHSSHTRVYGTYSMSDEQVGLVGLETHITPLKGIRTLVDVSYRPNTDSINTKFGYRKAGTTMNAWLTLRDVKSKNLDSHGEQVEFKQKISGKDTVVLFHDIQAKTSRVRLDHALDSDNSLQIDLHYFNKERKHVAAELQHRLNKRNRLVIASDWGSKKYSVDWKSSVDDGTWSLKYQFPFAASPRDGALTLKRRLDF